MAVRDWLSKAFKEPQGAQRDTLPPPTAPHIMVDVIDGNKIFVKVAGTLDESFLRDMNKGLHLDAEWKSLEEAPGEHIYKYDSRNFYISQTNAAIIDFIVARIRDEGYDCGFEREQSFHIKPWSCPAYQYPGTTELKAIESEDDAVELVLHAARQFGDIYGLRVAKYHGPDDVITFYDNEINGRKHGQFSRDLEA